MPRLRPAAALLALGVALAAPAAAQRPAPSDAPGLRLLAIPEGHRMLCRVPGADEAIAPADQPVVQREFQFDAPSTEGMPPGFPVIAPRTIAVVFDSAGAPLVMSDEAQLPLAGGEQLLVIFTGNVGVQGRHVRVDVDSARFLAAQASGDLEAMQAALRPPASRDLTDDEVERVRALAAWLWPRRCPAR